MIEQGQTWELEGRVFVAPGGESRYDLDNVEDVSELWSVVFNMESRLTAAAQERDAALEQARLTNVDYLTLLERTEAAEQREQQALTALRSIRDAASGISVGHSSLLKSQIAAQALANLEAPSVQP